MTETIRASKHDESKGTIRIPIVLVNGANSIGFRFREDRG